MANSRSNKIHTSNLIMSHIKNIRFTHQCGSAMLRGSGELGGLSWAGFRVAPVSGAADDAAHANEPTEHAMTALPSLQNTALLGREALDRVVAAVMRRAQHACEILRHRRDAVMLASFNDRMLADIGLTRADLNDAFAEPPWRDLTAVLVVRARERRAARRRSIWPWPEPRNVPAPSIVPQSDGCDAGSRVS
ncbi:MAG: DUF1127 domain-containing protein, partial [Rhodoplanes sp.]